MQPLQRLPPERQTELHARSGARLGLFTLACLLASPAAAQDVFRCGTERAVLYQQTPCEGGRPLHAVDARSSAQAHDARTVAQQQSRAAQVLESERLQRSRQPSPQAVVIGKRDSLDEPAVNALSKKKPASSKIRIVKQAKAAKKAKADASPASPPPREGWQRAR
ncbi:MAG: hypothetical protein ABI574_09415 [Burkholderiales bacterium]